MATLRVCPSCTALTLRQQMPTLRTLYISRTSHSPMLSEVNQQVRHATNMAKKKPAGTKRKKARTNFLEPDLKNMPQFPLLDAMRYIRAAEVGQKPTSAKYEIHVRLKTPKSSVPVRGRLRLPHAVKTDARICVIAAPDSSAAKSAIAAGAQVVGEETVFDAVKEGRIEFDRCICHQDSLQKLSKANIARILGPRGLMPSAKLGTVVKDVGTAVRDMVGGSLYRERLGVVRMPVGQLGFTADELQSNIKHFMDALKTDISALSDRVHKEIYEVVLSSTHGPGISLNGTLGSKSALETPDLRTA